ncbi:MAG: hypothetical protein ACK4WD_08530 [Flavobacteriales bacterium]|jgi:hypothetical protein
MNFKEIFIVLSVILSLETRGQGSYYFESVIERDSVDVLASKGDLDKYLIGPIRVIQKYELPCTDGMKVIIYVTDLKDDTEISFSLNLFYIISSAIEALGFPRNKVYLELRVAEDYVIRKSIIVRVNLLMLPGN